MQLIHAIEQGKHTKEITTALSMDMSGMFGNMTKDHLLQTLRQLGYTNAMQFWVDHL